MFTRLSRVDIRRGSLFLTKLKYQKKMEKKILNFEQLESLAKEKADIWTMKNGRFLHLRALSKDPFTPKGFIGQWVLIEKHSHECMSVTAEMLQKKPFWTGKYNQDFAASQIIAYHESKIDLEKKLLIEQSKPF